MIPSLITSKGYTWLALARQDVLPLTILEISKEKSRLYRLLHKKNENNVANIQSANIVDLFPQKKQSGHNDHLPKQEKPTACSFLKGYDIFDRNAHMQFQSETPLLPASISTNLRSENKILYSFGNVRHIATNDVKLERYINVERPDESAPGFYEKLNNSQLLVVTNVLQSQKISVKVLKNFNLDGTIDAEALEQYIKLQAVGGIREDRDQMEVYNGNFITFALKARLIRHEYGKYKLDGTPVTLVKAHQNLPQNGLDTIVHIE